MAAIADKGLPLEFEVSWRPFQLNSRAPPAVNKLDMYNRKFGPERVAKMIPYMTEVGKGDGISFSYGGDTGNTFDSHRMIEKAKRIGGQEQQDKVVEELFKAYFEQEKNLADRAVLLDAWKKAGLAEEDAGFLETEELTREVRGDVEQWSGVTSGGVPFFVVDGKYTLSGAQEPETFVRCFEKIAQESGL